MTFALGLLLRLPGSYALKVIDCVRAEEVI